MVKYFAVILVFLAYINPAHTQSVTNIRASQEDKKIIITYDLEGNQTEQSFTIWLMVSEDGGYSWQGPLTAVSGDAGTGINTGNSKQLVWDVLSEPGWKKLQGNRIAFKIRAETNLIMKSAGVRTPCTSMGSFTDPRDGQIYPTVQIGKQCWMQKNMNYKTGNSWCYETKELNCDTYGRLYDWQTALKLCPRGWHLPSDAEWTELGEYLGGNSETGGKLKEIGTNHWSSPNEKATNSSGFTALPGGNRSVYGNFFNLTLYALFWSSSENGATFACYRYINYGSGSLYRYFNDKTEGFSCRCIKDQ